jgi:hypothetical protein
MSLTLRKVTFGNDPSVVEFQAWAQLNCQTGTIIMAEGKLHSKRSQLLLWYSNAQQYAEHFNDAVELCLMTLSLGQATYRPFGL